MDWVLVAKPKAGPADHKKAKKKIENWPWGARWSLWYPPLVILLIWLISVYRVGWRWSAGNLDLQGGDFFFGRVSGQSVDVGVMALARQDSSFLPTQPVGGVDSGVWQAESRFAQATQLTSGAPPQNLDGHAVALCYTYERWDDRSIRQMNR